MGGVVVVVLVVVGRRDGAAALSTTAFPALWQSVTGKRAAQQPERDVLTALHNEQPLVNTAEGQVA